MTQVSDLEDRISELGDRLDGGDIFGIIRILQDNDDSLTLDSRLIRDIVESTQSNPKEAFIILSEMIECDDEIANIDAEI